MLTRIEIDGFKTFEGFSLDLQPLTAIVGPNASGKSNLFDALRFLSLLAQHDIRTAMQGLRGEPEELFRQTATGSASSMSFAVEVLLPRTGIDAFGASYTADAQRLRYEVRLAIGQGTSRGIFVRDESCRAILKMDDRGSFSNRNGIAYTKRKTPFIRTDEVAGAIEISQDGRQGTSRKLSLKEASRTALSTISTSEFPHLYALREILSDIRFLEIDPRAARGANDRFEGRVLKSDASNLSAVLAHMKDETANKDRPDGVLSDIAADLASLIPSVRRLEIQDNPNQRQYSFSLQFVGDLMFSSRVISDGTLRLLALLTVLNDPRRRGTLCFEEPENGVHEGRVPMLVDFLRDAVAIGTEIDGPAFQVLLNTHSPTVMAALHDDEIVAADNIVGVDPATGKSSVRTRMRPSIQPSADLIDPERYLTRFEVERLLRKSTDAA